MKNWYRSKTVWGAIAVILASLMQLAGYEFGTAEQAELTDTLSGLAGTVGGLLALYGRVTARLPISQK